MEKEKWGCTRKNNLGKGLLFDVNQNMWMESLTNLIKDELMSEGYSFSVEKFNVFKRSTILSLNL